MPQSSNNEPAKRQEKTLDLSELQSLSFGPNWSERKESSTGGAGRGARGDFRPSREGGARPGGGRDRRSSQRRERSDAPRAPQGEAGSGEQPRGEFRGGQRPDRGGDRSNDRGERRPRGEFRGGNRGERGDRHAQQEPPFEPLVDVLFYPEDTPFKALSHAMRTSCRTYELFEIARLILDKPDRHVLVLKPRSDGKGITQLYQSVPDGLPFASEEEAVAHVIKHSLERFFEVQTVSCEPPKGAFPVINRCGITGTLIGPPNYHRYQTLLQEHHARELAKVPFDKFLARVESVKDEEVLAKWLEQMSTQTLYKLKSAQPAQTAPADAEGAEAVEQPSEVLDSLESVRYYLTSKRLNEVVRKVPQVRLSGLLVEGLPQGDIRKSLFAAQAQQRRFPLESANNLRGRLRRLKFTIYKRKGVSFVCAVKRNFRTEETHFAESVQDLVKFIEANPNVPVSQLPEKYLGIELKKAEKTALPAREKAPDIESVSEEDARKIVEAHELKNSSATEVQAGPAPAAAEEQAPQLEDPRVRQLLLDLRWLITEGYVTEFGDGRLYAPPVLSVAAAKAAALADGGDYGHSSHEEEAHAAEEADGDSPAACDTASASAPAEPVAQASAESAAEASSEQKPVSQA